MYQSLHRSNMTTYILISCSHSKGVDRYIRSVARHCGKAKPVIVMFRPFFDVPDTFLTYPQNRPFPGVVQRFYPLAKVIEDLGPENWYVWTDCSDVIMQTALSDLDLYQTDILVSCEQMRHNQVPFWYEVEYWPDFKCLWKEPIYNAGCFAMKGRAFLDFIFELRKYCTGREIRKLALDQLLLNKWLLSRPFKNVDDLFLNLYATYIHGHRLMSGEQLRWVEFRNGLFRRGEHIYPFVHGNGGGKEFLDRLVTGTTSFKNNPSTEELKPGPVPPRMETESQLPSSCHSGLEPESREAKHRKKAFLDSVYRHRSAEQALPGMT